MDLLHCAPVEYQVMVNTATVDIYYTYMRTNIDYCHSINISAKIISANHAEKNKNEDSIVIRLEWKGVRLYGVLHV